MQVATRRIFLHWHSFHQSAEWGQSACDLCNTVSFEVSALLLSSNPIALPSPSTSSQFECLTFDQTIILGEKTTSKTERWLLFHNRPSTPTMCWETDPVCINQTISSLLRWTSAPLSVELRMHLQMSESQILSPSWIGQVRVNGPLAGCTL
jgi:hypothetical protein